MTVLAGVGALSIYTRENLEAPSLLEMLGYAIMNVRMVARSEIKRGSVPPVAHRRNWQD